MRLISGSHAGRVLRVPAGLPVRPTTDLAKESLFNILNNRVDFEGLKVLDLFSGTGNISLEFASRGAGQVLSVDSNPKCIDFLSKTARSFGFEHVVTIRSDVFRFLARPAGSFDIVFADPPYDMASRETLPGLIFGSNFLLVDGWLIVEHDSRISFKKEPGFAEERKYGKVHFSFFRKPE